MTGKRKKITLSRHIKWPVNSWSTIKGGAPTHMKIFVLLAHRYEFIAVRLLARCTFSDAGGTVLSDFLGFGLRD